ncbi:MAG: beta-ketoacyl-[acyl-carrier-protein] synthase family protein [Desulfovibrio alaskensis]|jgi:3-oxoacyl-[acyl-carrier-protein] synthase II|nr:beta-ketoacyl-[acyl-carrier-protein] synthase family protein [Oleidesulfovibrio alaskensis]
MQAERRVVITGAGAVTPLGHTPQDIRQSVLTGRTVFEPTSVPAGYAQAPAQFDADDALRGWRHRRYLNRGAAMAVHAARQAAGAAGFAAGLPGYCGIFAGSGPHLDMDSDYAQPQHLPQRHDTLCALWMLRYLPNTAASAISQLLGARGESLVTGTACAASLQAVGEAFRRIRHGVLPVALAGGGDSRLSYGGLLAYAKAGALAPCSEDTHAAAAAACRPFDTGRQGFAAGEGAAFFVLESLDHAQKRGAVPLAEVCGYGCSMDGHAMTAPHPQGMHAEQAVRTALHEAGAGPADVTAVCAHGTGTLRNDTAESVMLTRLFDPTGHRPPVLALKSWTGHCASACGAVELAVLLACARHGFLPPVRNLQTPLCDSLSFVRRIQPCTAAELYAAGRPEKLSALTLLQSFGFGGQNAALAVRPFRASTAAAIQDDNIPA